MQYKMWNLGDKQAIANNIDAACQDYGNGKQALQNALINVIIHIGKNGDPVYANRLAKNENIDAPDLTAIVSFMEAFGRCDWDKEAEMFVVNKTKEVILDGKEGKAAKSTMWWTFKPKTPPKYDYDYAAELLKLNSKAIKQEQKRVKLVGEGDTDHADKIIIDDAMMRAVRLIAGKVVDPNDVLALAVKKSA